MVICANTSIRTAGARSCLGLIGAIGSIGMLAGCVANSSNPVVSIALATMSDHGAVISLHLANPGGRDLTVQSLEYELSHGEMAFPLSSGTWTGQIDLLAQDEAELQLSITFDSEPIEEDSTLLHLNGQLHFVDHTGFLGMSSMDLTETSFQLDTQAQRNDQ